MEKPVTQISDLNPNTGKINTNDDVNDEENDYANDDVNFSYPSCQLFENSLHYISARHSVERNDALLLYLALPYCKGVPSNNNKHRRPYGEKRSFHLFSADVREYQAH